MPSIYEEEGFETRRDYLESLVEDYGVEPETVYILADLLGPEEDFDGLISELNEVTSK